MEWIEYDYMGRKKRLKNNEDNRTAAAAEADNGYTVYDDGQAEPAAPAGDTEARLAALEAELASYEAAYTEGVESV